VAVEAGNRPSAGLSLLNFIIKREVSTSAKLEAQNNLNYLLENKTYFPNEKHLKLDIFGVVHLHSVWFQLQTCHHPNLQVHSQE